MLCWAIDYRPIFFVSGLSTRRLRRDVRASTRLWPQTCRRCSGESQPTSSRSCRNRLRRNSEKGWSWLEFVSPVHWGVKYQTISVRSDGPTIWIPNIKTSSIQMNPDFWSLVFGSLLYLFVSYSNEFEYQPSEFQIPLKKEESVLYSDALNTRHIWP